jgi:protein-disulfide isomerase
MSIHRPVWPVMSCFAVLAALPSPPAGAAEQRLKRDMASPPIEAALKSNRTLADALDIRGTPGFVVGDQIVPGAIELSSLKELFTGARRK